MTHNLLQEYFVSAQYFAPRGKERIIFLGEVIAHRHLNYNDRLIGIIGDAGSGKSSLIKGMFPGLELANDDDIMNPRKIMLVRDALHEGLPDASTYHMDMRFLMAFMQMSDIVDYVKEILKNNRRVVVEHFNLLYPALKINADLIVGIGEEIIVSRPSIFGPTPQGIYDMVHFSLIFRRMAHTAEELTVISLLEEVENLNENSFYSSDIRNGFVLRFYEKPEIDFDAITKRVQKMIDEKLDVCYKDDKHIRIGDRIIPCDGPRIHVSNTSKIEDFHIVPYLVHDKKTKTYCLVGLIGGNYDNIEDRNTTYFLHRSDI
ncbi:lantibiotic ABC transporter [Porphyromonas macacae]|uniref:Lantibiotic ABC transporter n=3 Tax=Porphyromonas macacae TaxID=28115 RepID=A0A0A2E7L0_9PORP|nr:alanine-tRNA synthetase second additional domain-containing protein [Porphyromonas macacae]KGN74851.1 lantibiotic ABC transporter [Porphyromonas macacae]SUB77919.1 Uncharacterised protein [Porphyromonas macacae]SUB89032.1 Uncharacterised protein [Porphyromonas macacae]